MLPGGGFPATGSLLRSLLARASWSLWQARLASRSKSWHPDPWNSCCWCRDLTVVDAATIVWRVQFCLRWGLASDRSESTVRFGDTRHCSGRSRSMTAAMFSVSMRRPAFGDHLSTGSLLLPPHLLALGRRGAVTCSRRNSAHRSLAWVTWSTPHSSRLFQAKKRLPKEPFLGDEAKYQTRPY